MQFRGRCPARWFVGRHAPMMTEKRDASNVIVPYVVVWQCFYCDRQLGETPLWPPRSYAPPAPPSRWARARHNVMALFHVARSA
jgi:hypothetical protein